MVEVSTPLSIWMQIGSLFFTLSGIHSDLLIIRFFLFAAYVMLFVNAVLGSPLWPDISNTGFLPLDSLFWSFAGLYVHGSSLLNLLLDELPVTLGDDEAALWRLFYRTGGLSARLYKNIVSPYVKVVTFAPDEEIPTEDFFYILYKGDVHLKVYQDGKLKTERVTMTSGSMFDMKYLGMFTEDHFFLDHSIACTSKTHSVLFCFSRDDMKKIAQHHLVKSVWQSLVINNLSSILENYMEQQANFSDPKLDDNDDSSTRTDRIFRPLEEWELPDAPVAGSGMALQHPLQHFWQALYRQFSPPWPLGKHLSGIRQTNLSAPVGSPSDDPQSFTSLHGRYIDVAGKSITRMITSLSCKQESNDDEEDQHAADDLEA